MAMPLVNTAMSEDSVSDNPQDSAKDCVLESVGCCFEKAARDVIKSRLNTDGILSCFQAFCETPKFMESVTCLGLQSPTFTPSKLARPGNSAFDKFANACRGLVPTSRLGIVFHGTRKENIPDILRNGLDPTKRSGQAYGPGEYFSKEPGVSVSYCGEGQHMLVFVVVVPVPTYNCPPDYVVVKNNDHQVPLGVLSFKGVDHNIMEESQMMKAHLKYLTMEVFRKSQEAEEATAKATIIQLLFKQRIDIASEKYQKEMNRLTDISKREISMYVHNFLDEDVVDYYFPELPEPMLAKERDSAPIKSVDETQEEVSKAKYELAKENSNVANLLKDSASKKRAIENSAVEANRPAPGFQPGALPMFRSSSPFWTPNVSSGTSHVSPINLLPFSTEDDLTLWNGSEAFGDRWDMISNIYFGDLQSAHSLKTRWNSPEFKRFITNRFGSKAFE